MIYMKVCIIENIYPPYDRGGAEQVVAKTVEGLLHQGHDVIIITTMPQGNVVETDAHLTIYRRRPWNLFFYTDAQHHSVFVRFLWHAIDMVHIPMMWWVRGVLKKEQPDVVHTHNLMGLSFLIPRMIRRLGFPHIHTVHDVQLVEPSAMILKTQEKSWRYTGWPTNMYSWLMNILMGSPDIVISPSQFLLDFYQSRGFFSTSEFVVLRNPMTMDVSGEKKKKPERRPFRFLYLGQIERHKGIVFLIEVFQQLIREKNENCELHIVGSGSIMPEVESLVRGTPQIRIHGRMDRSQIPELFSQTDVTVVPSLCYENSPTVIFESLTCGVPVVASRIEGIAELIQEGENGLTFETEDSASLREKLLWCLEHREQIQHMSTKAVQSVVGLSLREYIERLVVLYGRKKSAGLRS
ncbi:MAG TPA: hypothetical protein DCY48_00140 [Candidatus Magasanikbacteria bacterium]|nr:MAG: hypothetical protein A3I74_04835 [Candidatus Magasanikbacteria bacterium RIFCSPLOWO2_02_FULL_47_16]OGH79738.1 MAG: hypothetical protein A3C10_03985 [Candidatus Magasanikbacteria bacterium RIFCSPHIGHO2_02_FULL_48_18]OGH82284.1 MAG: hypothetical protein A3G08_03325 [Candidatus Magasanikbacteria bacterium RIFCSPLOWO2_12_FULL_47_9b]HAZ28176.1 hypothetical protein [Candidatus Magasanikbacteria bacterium]